YHGALPEDPARPLVVEFVERLADACAAGPILYLSRGFCQRYIHILITQGACDIVEPRAESEAIDPVAIVGNRVHEMQEHAGVSRHRARDVAQDDERRRPVAWLA